MKLARKNVNQADLLAALPDGRVTAARARGIRLRQPRADTVLGVAAVGVAVAADTLRLVNPEYGVVGAASSAFTAYGVHWFAVGHRRFIGSSAVRPIPARYRCSTPSTKTCCTSQSHRRRPLCPAGDAQSAPIAPPEPIATRRKEQRCDRGMAAGSLDISDTGSKFPEPTSACCRCVLQS